MISMMDLATEVDRLDSIILNDTHQVLIESAARKRGEILDLMREEIKERSTVVIRSRKPTLNEQEM